MHVDEVTDGDETDYLHGMGQTLARIENGAFTYLHPDHLGSAQTGTAEDGAVAWNEHYTPFGEALNSNAANDNQGGFTGHIKDKSTGLNYMQARYYDPNIGRFLSVDPIGFSPTNPGSFGRYTYSLNDPVNRIDPNGEESFLVSRKVIGKNNHAFVVVVENGKVTDQFSYGPQRNVPAFRGKLVSHGKGSRIFTDDAKAFKSYQTSSPHVAKLNISIVKINASDPTVRAAGKAVDLALGDADNPSSGAPLYDPVPLWGTANSNSGANAVRTLSEEYDGNTSSEEMPSAGYHPGANQQKNVPSASFSVSGGVIYGSRASGTRIKRKDE